MHTTKKYYTCHQLLAEELATCNCINVLQCSLGQKCPCSNILYQATIIPLDKNSETKVCYDIHEKTFKLPDANHKKLFNLRNC